MSSSALAAPARLPLTGEAGSAAIVVSDLSKVYQIYDLPQHRLWQSLWRGRRRFYREFHALRHVTLRRPPWGGRRDHRTKRLG